MPNDLFDTEAFEVEAPVLDAVKNPQLRGVTTDKGAGVMGVSHAKKSLGLLGGSDRVFHQSAGVYGESSQQGVFGHSTDSNGTGVYGNSTGSGWGVRGDSTDGIAVQGQSFGNGLAGKFIGNVEITGTLNGLPLNALIQKLNDLEKTVNDLRDRMQSSQPNITPSNVPKIHLFNRGVSDGIHRFALRATSLEKNRLVTIRIQDSSSFRHEISTFNSGPNGAFDDLSNPCSFQVSYSGRADQLFIAITDGRANSSDPTGLLWSNTVRGSGTD
jgi:hypothetical protein